MSAFLHAFHFTNCTNYRRNKVREHHVHQKKGAQPTTFQREPILWVAMLTRLPCGIVVLDVLSFLGGCISCRLSLNIVVLSASFLRHVLSSDPSFGRWQGSLLLPPSSEHCVALCSACHLHLVLLCPLSFSPRLFFFLHVADHQHPG